METIWLRLFGVILITLLMATFLNGHQPHLAVMLVVASICCCTVLILPYGKALVSFFENLTQISGISSQELAPIWKIIVIAACTRTLAELCRDCNQKALAAKTEIAGAVMALICALPLLQKTLELLQAVK